jgi:hypothetical protein
MEVLQKSIVVVGLDILNYTLAQYNFYTFESMVYACTTENQSIT